MSGTITRTINPKIDLVVRYVHLLILFSFTGAYLTGGEAAWHQIHMAFGYTLAFCVAVRVLWQIIAMAGYIPTKPILLQQRFSLFKQLLPHNKLSGGYKISKATVQAASMALFQLSIFLIFILLPVTVIFGYFTDLTANHDLKEIHEVCANLFLITVLVHLSTLSLNSVLTKKWLAKRIFLGGDAQPFLAICFVLVLSCVVLSFWMWYLR